MLGKIGLYSAFCLFFCGSAYWLTYNPESLRDELFLVLYLILFVLLYRFMFSPAWKQAKKNELSLSSLSKNLKLDEGDTVPSTETWNKLPRIFEQSRQFIVSLKTPAVNVEVDNEFKNNDLVKALYELKIHMNSLSEREAERQWVAESMSKSIDLLRAVDQNENEFYDRILSALVRLIQANQGALFLLNESDSGEKHLELASCYAYERKKFVNDRIDPGQGLVGQVYLEGTTLILKEVPKDYIRITSGLGEALPKYLIIVPFKLNDQTECILELASFQEIPAYKIQFLEKVGESIASSIISAKTTQQMKKLLAESQSNAEELRAQEEEMRQHMEELNATQEEMARKEKELLKTLEQADQQRKELNKQLVEIEKLKLANENYKKDVIEILNSIPAKIFLKDKDGVMVLCNNAVALAYNLTVEKLVGTHDRDHFDPEQAKEFRKQELEVMSEGLKTYLQEERLNGQLRYFKTTKMPFYIHHLNQTGLLGYQFDVTELTMRSENAAK